MRKGLLSIVGFIAVLAIGSCSDSEDPLAYVRASGHVLDGASMPIENTVVKIQEWTGTEYVDRELQNTNVTGAYNIRYENSKPSFGPLRLSAIAAGFVEGIVDLQPGENNGITVTLDPQP